MTQDGAGGTVKTAGPPPRPRLTLRVGITGHRPNSLQNADLTAIEAGVHGRLADFATSIRTLWRAEMALACPAYSAMPPLLRVVTALAEGADRMAARAALALNSAECTVEISCPLPFPRARYAKDFADDLSRREFETLLGQAQQVLEFAAPTGAEAAQSYLAAGVATLQNADVLLCVWNGKEPSGRGGTGEIVQRAATAGLPVIWVKPSAPQAIAVIWPKRQPYQLAELTLAQLSAAAAPLTPELLSDIMLSVCGPPIGAERAELDDFLQRPVPGPARPNDAHWRQFFERLPSAAQHYAASVGRLVLPRYACADALASDWAARHRRGYSLNFLLAATAVFFALISVPVEGWKIYTTLAEVACIAAILFLTGIGQSQRWHGRWIENRLLAENLRQMLFLPMTGAAARVQKSRGGASNWTEFYAAATQREIDLPGVVADGVYVRAASEALRRGVIADQIAYHRHRALRFPRHEHRLHLLGAACILGALFVSLLFLGARGYSCMTGAATPYVSCFFNAIDMPDWLSHAKHWVPFLAGVLPAFGAAAYGVRLQSDFEGTQARSSEMLKSLEALDAALAAEAETMSFARLGEFAGFAADIMKGDLATWQLVFEGRPLALPG